jgi:hypothetical protein
MSRIAVANRARLTALTVVTLAGTLATAGCHDAAQAFGASPSAARANADQLFTALEQRFTGVERAPKFAAARAKMFHDALVPSRVYADTSAWNVIPNPQAQAPRSLVVTGTFAVGHYSFIDNPTAGLPTQPGESRHIISLERSPDGAEYNWATEVSTAWGSVTGDDLAHVLAALVAHAATTPHADLRDECRTAFPRSAATLGRLLSLDTLRATPIPDGSARITLVSTIHPDWIKPTFPAYAAYLQKYVASTRITMQFADNQGGEWLDFTLADNHLTITLRGASDGSLVPINDPPTATRRPMPASLIMHSDWFAKMSLFTVGMSDLDANVTVIHQPHERGWLIELHREPKWHLPLAAARLMHASIRRPFEGAGTAFRYALRDSAGAQSLFNRSARTTVKESTIMKWMGGLGGAAAGEFAGKSEAEENQFDAETFAAIRADLDAITTTAARP